MANAVSRRSVKGFVGAICEGKHFNFDKIYPSVRLRLGENQRCCGVGMFPFEIAQHIVTRHFGVYRSSSHYGTKKSGNTREQPRSGRPRVTSHQQDNTLDL